MRENIRQHQVTWSYKVRETKICSLQVRIFLRWLEKKILQEMYVVRTDTSFAVWCQTNIFTRQHTSGFMSRCTRPCKWHSAATFSIWRTTLAASFSVYRLSFLITGNGLDCCETTEWNAQCKQSKCRKYNFSFYEFIKLTWIKYGPAILHLHTI